MKSISSNRREIIGSLLSKRRRPFDVARFSFRFVGLSSGEALNFKSVFHEFCPHENEFDDDRRHVVVIELHSATKKKFLSAFDKATVSSGVKKEIWASMLTKRDSFGFDFPKYVIEVVLKTGCDVSVTFTVV